MHSALKQRARQAVEMARAAGASEVWSAARHHRATEFNYRDARLETVKQSTSRSLSLRLYVEGRYSRHSTTDLDPGRLDGFVREAVALTRALAEDPFRQIPDPALFNNRPEVDLELVDPAIDALDNATREAWCHTIWEAAKAHEAAISTTSFVSDGHSYSASVSSNGFEGESERTSLWLGASVTLQDVGDKRPEGSFFAGGSHLGDIPSPGEAGARTLATATSRLGSKRGPTQRGTLVVHPRATGRLLARFVGPANAGALHQGRTFWKGRLGKVIASPLLSIVDDPLIVRGLSSRHFDSEGISAQRIELVDKGVARNLYVGTYYGQKTEMTPTTANPSNRVVLPGERSFDEIIKDVGDGICITSWLGGNADNTTGAFSLGIRGHLIEGGVLGQPIGEMNIAGNLVELFGQLVEVGNDPWPWSSLRVPTLVFDGVQFSGS